jgi:hypothetical protein
MNNDRMSQDAYTRVALRLRDIGPADREWLLSQLGADDCRRVSAALQAHRARTPPGAGPSRLERQPPKPAGNAEAQPLARLNAATFVEMKMLLAGQPDWAIALLLSAGPWPWGQEFLGDLAPERIRALRSLAGELVRQVKPQLSAAVVRLMALKLEPPVTDTPVTQAFDAALQRAVSELTAVDRWKLDLS